jgi:hypothetical protein
VVSAVPVAVADGEVVDGEVDDDDEEVDPVEAEEGVVTVVDDDRPGDEP